jgi:methionyl aminopeptidase
MIIRKSEAEMATMREAGRVAALALAAVGAAAAPGVTTGDLDALAEETIRSQGALPAFKGYRGFPATICASPNEVIVHGIPGSLRLVEGDIFSVDVGSILDGYYGDTAATFAIGRVGDVALRLMAATLEGLEAAIAECRPGRRLGDVGAAVQEVAEAAGFSVVREYVGHGIGRAMHEEPSVPNYGQRGRGVELAAGMVLAIEPMVNAGTSATCSLDDGWTVVTEDRALSAHFEHTVAITESGPEVLTRL